MSTSQKRNRDESDNSSNNNYNNNTDLSELDSCKRQKYMLKEADEYVLINKSNVYDVGNTIYFVDDVHMLSIQKFIKILDKKILENVKQLDDNYTLTYVVKSGGGSVPDILHFVDHIRMTKQRYPNVKFVSVATGIVASAASIMCVVADEKNITKYAKSMIHELSSSMPRKNFTRIKSDFKLTNMYHNDLCDIYLANIRKNSDDQSVLSRVELEKLLLDETWYSAEEYVNAGFADKVL